ncbi:MAG: site-2 protease family protein [Ruminiclostridium sp.]|nr:site-2 protease family protein [Ruminiclostridium sp.]
MISALMSGNMVTIILSAFSILVMLFVVFPVHECSHALAAKALGDDTADRMGRITLNPFAHLDLIGTIGIVLFRVGWAKPVPVNTARCRKIRSQKAAMAIVAAAGPMANIVSSLVFMIIEKVLIVSCPTSDTLYYILLAIEMIIQLDLFNGVFNLLPIPPFDGSRVFLTFLPEKYYFKIMQYEQFIMIGLLALMYTGILAIPFQFLTDAIYNLLDLITSFIC